MRESAFLLLYLCIISFACKKSNQSFSNSEILKSHIAAYTSGEVSAVAPVIVQLANDVVEQDLVGQPADDKLLSFEPKIYGTAVWIDARTLKFTPSEKLKSNTAYKATLNIASLIKNLPKEASNFYFDFKTKAQGIYLDAYPAVYSETDQKFSVAGMVELNDVGDLEEVKKCITSTFSGSKKDINWEETDLKNAKSTFRFSINNLDIPAEDQNLEIFLNGSPLGTKDKLSKKIVIPSTKGFRFIDSKVQNVPDQVVKIYFNTQISLKQDLTGLVQLSNNADHILDVESNVLYIYPSTRLSGDFKLTIDKSLNNQEGKQLSEPLQIDIKFEDLKPAVIVGNKNMILPDSGKLLLPFQAVSLNAVDVEIFKIYNSNILQYLQAENQYDINLEQVGKIISQQKIVLDNSGLASNTLKYKKYSIDLSKIIAPEPDAFYQVRIGFRPEYSTYTCDEPLPSSTTSSYKPGSWGYHAEFSEGQFTSIMNYYDGYFGFGPDDEWDSRENPCHPMYYNSSRFLNVMVYSSNIGLIAKSGKAGEVMVIATDLNTTKPLNGVDITFYDYQLQQVKTAKTNADGIAMATGFKVKPFAVVAQQGGRKGYLRLIDNEALNISQFDVVGEDVQKGVKGFLYGERGVWRPGDSLYLNFMMQSGDQTNIPDGVPVNFEFFDSRGILQSSQVLSSSSDRLYPIYIATRPDAVTGNWKAVLKVGGAVFNFPVKIENIKPNRMRIKLDFGKKELTSSDEPVNCILSANWLYGAPAKNLDARIDVSMWQSKEGFKKFQDFRINNIREAPFYTTFEWFKGRLNDLGNTKISQKLLPKESNATGPMVVNFKTKVFEQGGEPNVDNVNVTYHPFNRYCGVSVLKNSYGAPTYNVNENVPISLASISTDGNGISQTALKVEIFRVDWSWWWDEDNSNSYSYYKSEMENPIQSYSVKTNAQGKANVQFKSAEWGRYYVRVTDPVSGHTSGEYFYCGYPETEDNYNAIRAASIVPVMSDKENYNVGEEVKLKLECPDKARVLVSLENGSKVVKAMWYDAVKGNNEFKFKTTAEMSPNVYANVSIVQRFGQNVNDMPVRMYGIIPIKVEDKNTRLNPVISMPSELKPSMRSSITINEQSGKAMSYTIDIVDEGLLDLTHFATPDPWKKFFAREALGVKTWDLFDRLAGTFTESSSQILSIGGDAGKAPNPDKQRAIRFKPMVVHLGPFRLEKGKKATHNFTVPNYIGSVRAMVVAIGDGAYGNAEKTIPVRSPLMVLASFPRVIGVGETIKVPVNVFTTNDKVKNVSVTVSDKAGLLQNKSNAQVVSFSKADEKVVYVDLTAGDREGISKITIHAKGNGETAYQEIEVDIRNPNPVQTTLVSSVVQSGKTADINLAFNGVKGTNKATLEVSSMLPVNLSKNLQYLISYPHGCIEQITSGAFPQLYVSNFTKLSPKQQSETERIVKSVLNRYKNYANADGGFNYWPGGNYSNNWATIYAGHFMVEAKNAGYNVPNNLLESWIKSQRKMASVWSAKQYESGLYEANSTLVQAYRLYVLALGRSADKGAMNRLREVARLDRTSIALLAAAYALDGKKEIARTLINMKTGSIPTYDYAGYTYGSELRDESILLETYQLCGMSEQADKLAVDISKYLNKHGTRYSTQTLAFSLSALGKYIGRNTKAGRELHFAYSLDGKKEITVKTKDAIMLIELNTDEAATGKLKLRNLGSAPLYSSVTLTGKPAMGKELEDARNLEMTMRFTDLNGQQLDPQKLTRGKEFIVSIQVRNPGSLSWDYTNLALTQVFPSGWEINNPRMSDVNFARSSGGIEYQDFRDDRVLSYFGLGRNREMNVQIQLTAAYPGRYYLPGTQCEAMYDGEVYSHKKGMWVTVL